MITVNEVDDYIRRLATPVASETLPLHQGFGRCLRQALIAKRPAPPFDRVMMDGFAIKYSTKHRSFFIAGTTPAGQEPELLADSESAIEVMTGAMLPPGADCIVPVESCEIRDRMILLSPDCKIEPGQFIHRLGSEYSSGDSILSSGVQLNSAHLALAASEGYAWLDVSANLRVLLVTTGDEIISLGNAPKPWQIYGTHATAISAPLGRMHDVLYECVHVNDSLDALTKTLCERAKHVDLVILCGAMSKGRKDYGIQAIEHSGFEVIFHRVAQRPGHPMALARHKGTLLFGLPGNPLAVLFTFYRYVLPALDRLRGIEPLSPLAIKLKSDTLSLADATRYVPCQISNGQPILSQPHNSGDLRCLACSNGFVEIPPKNAETESGNYAYYWPWS